MVSSHSEGFLLTEKIGFARSLFMVSLNPYCNDSRFVLILINNNEEVEIHTCFKDQQMFYWFAFSIHKTYNVVNFLQ